MKLSYKQRLFLYFAIVFTVFTTGVLVFEQAREKTFRTIALEEKLDVCVEIVNTALLYSKDTSYRTLDSLLALLPQNIRLSLIDKTGKVLFDNSVKDLFHLENHSQRPEIVKALKSGKGSDIRTSASTGCEYLYYARKFDDRYIRVALPYDVRTQRFLKTDNLFLCFILALFAAVLVLMNAIIKRFGKSVKQLRDFAVYSKKEDIPAFTFPDDELGEIGLKITENYRQLQESKKEIDLEREKLLQHVHSSEEGICFFTADKEVEFYNSLFIQYLNTLTDEPAAEPSVIFSEDVFREMNRFLSEKTGNYHEIQIKKQGKTFSLRINVFENNGFEIILNDITGQEKTRRMKQEMTGNIAHELRTPVTSIRGYLETVLEQSPDETKKQYFITQAYHQTIVLSELIRDMSLITKIEEAPQSFKTEKVNISNLLKTLKNDLTLPLQKKNINMQWHIPATLNIEGNRHLLYSIFRNLTDNAIRYAGEGVEIQINLYSKDNDFYYFSFYDTGVGIPDERYLNHLFERFYRINEGRTRDTGGSGLGLSIVKNAVAFHKGSIVAKNRPKGGLEFLFKLRKQEVT
ncbi:MAG: HAMP domain-containing histidine kinase [Tannerella sp.]|jgi:signal transduction histidine kinase|nr:HAMP domain-containing histidine kinase [Tannerella sp.]